MSVKKGEGNMYRKNAAIAGVLFLLGFAGALSATVLKPMLAAADMLEAFAGNAGEVRLSALGLMVMGLACSGIAVALYPAIRQRHPGMALGSVVFRGIEGVLHLLVAVTFLTVLSVSCQEGDTGGLTALMRVTLDTSNDMVFAATCAWGIGALLYYAAMRRQRLVPAWLALWGTAGMGLSMLSGVLCFLGVYGTESALNTALNMPIALQELTLAAWLIVKGFGPGVQGKPRTLSAA